jgi:hypothetical protein
MMGVSQSRVPKLKMEMEIKRDEVKMPVRSKKRTG